MKIEKEIEMNIYVGNLAREVTDEDLREAFEAFGQVNSATVIKDRFSGESRGFGFVEIPSKNEAQTAITSRGFGFVEIPSKNEAQTAITEMNGKELKGRVVNVNEARPKTDRGGGGRGRGGFGGGGGRGGRRY
jgi:RNA recognition motif-containing protein